MQPARTRPCSSSNEGTPNADIGKQATFCRGCHAFLPRHVFTCSMCHRLHSDEACCSSATICYRQWLVYPFTLSVRAAGAAVLHKCDGNSKCIPHIVLTIDAWLDGLSPLEAHHKRTRHKAKLYSTSHQFYALVEHIRRP